MPALNVGTGIEMIVEKDKKFKEQAQKFLKPEGKLLSWGGDYFEYLLK